TIHEVGHALGLMHEHVRGDRDQYVSVNTSNVISTQVQNFQIYGGGSGMDDLPFNFSSLMMYGSTIPDEWKKVPGGSNVVITRRSDGTQFGSQRLGLAPTDILTLERNQDPTFWRISAPVSRTTGKISVLALAKDYSIKSSVWGGTSAGDLTYKSWNAIKFNGSTLPGGTIVAVARDANTIDAFTVGWDERILTSQWNSARFGGWSEWKDLAAPEAWVGTGIGAAAVNGTVHAFYVDKQSQLRYFTLDAFQNASGGNVFVNE